MDCSGTPPSNSLYSAAVFCAASSRTTQSCRQICACSSWLKNAGAWRFYSWLRARREPPCQKATKRRARMACERTSWTTGQYGDAVGWTGMVMMVSVQVEIHYAQASELARCLNRAFNVDPADVRPQCARSRSRR